MQPLGSRPAPGRTVTRRYQISHRTEYRYSDDDEFLRPRPSDAP